MSYARSCVTLANDTRNIFSQLNFDLCTTHTHPALCTKQQSRLEHTHTHTICITPKLRFRAAMHGIKHAR